MGARRMQVDERRAQLLELGQRLFSEHPYEDLSIDAIADAAGISKGLLYHYFGSKRGFYIATLREAASELLAAVLPDERLPAHQRARAGLLAYLDFVEAHAKAFTALMRGGLGLDPEIVELVKTVRESIAGQALLGLGLTEARPVFRVAIMSWVGAVEAASLELVREGPPRSGLRRQSEMLLLGQLVSTLRIASSLDPDAELAPEVREAFGAGEEP